RILRSILARMSLRTLLRIKQGMGLNDIIGRASLTSDSSVYAMRVEPGVTFTETSIDNWLKAAKRGDGQWAQAAFDLLIFDASEHGGIDIDEYAQRDAGFAFIWEQLKRRADVGAFIITHDDQGRVICRLKR